MSEFVLITLAAGAATYGWRGLGVALGRRIDPEGELFRWVSCVAYAMIAGLLARVLLMPAGPMAETLLVERALAAGAALAAFFLLTRRNLFAGVAAGGLAIVLLQLAR